MKTEIMKMLKEYHTKQGVLFLSEEDSEDYFKGLVEIVEELVLKNLDIEEFIKKDIVWHESGKPSGNGENWDKGFIGGMTHILKTIKIFGSHQNK